MSPRPGPVPAHAPAAEGRGSPREKAPPRTGASSLQVEGDGRPPTLPIDAGIGRSGLHVNCLDQPEACMRKPQCNAALRIGPRTNGFLRIALAHGHDEHIRHRLATKGERQRQLAAGMDRVRVLARHELEREAKWGVEEMRRAARGPRSVEQRLGATIETITAGSRRLSVLLPLVDDSLEPFVPEIVLELLRLERHRIGGALIADPMQTGVRYESDAGGVGSRAYHQRPLHSTLAFD